MGAGSSIVIGTVLVAAVAGCGGDDSGDRPSYDEGNVAAAWVDGTDLVAVDGASGDERWRRPAGPTPAVYADDGQLYVAVDGSLVALDAAAGEEVWRAEIGLVVTLVPVPDGIAVAVDGGPMRVVVLDATSGVERWHDDLDAEDAAQVSIAITEDVIYVNDYHLLIAYDETGEHEWVAPAAGSAFGSDVAVRMVAEEGRVFTLGDQVWDVSPRRGGGKLMRENVSPSDVAVVGDYVVIAGTERLEAVPLVEL